MEIPILLNHDPARVVGMLVDGVMRFLPRTVTRGMMFNCGWRILVEEEVDGRFYIVEAKLQELSVGPDPLAFTWEDVDALQVAADGYQRRVRASGENAEWDGFARMRSLADRIAALLPPRG